MKKIVHSLHDKLKMIFRYSMSFYGLLLATWIIPGNLWAQSIVPPSHPDLLLTNFSSPFAYFTNNDLISLGNGNSLMAFDWKSGANVDNVWVQDNSGNSTNVAISNCDFFSDIAIGCMINSGSPEYYLAIIYQNTSQEIKLSVYTISNVGTFGMSLNPVIGSPFTLSQTGVIASNPRIDAFANPTGQSVNGFPALDRMVVSWNEQSGNNSLGKSSIFPVDNPNSVTSNIITVSSSVTGIALEDVASSFDFNQSAYMAYYVGRNTDSMFLFTYNLNSGTINKNFVASTTGFSEAKIAAMSFFNPALITNPWIIVASKPISISEQDIYFFDQSNLGGVNCSIALPGILDAFEFSVSAGLGVSIGSVSGYANRNYTVSWVGVGDRLISRSVDAVTGGISNMFPNYYQINYPNDFHYSTKGVIATSACNNSGEYLLSSWIDNPNQNIFYKVSQNTVLYKTTEIQSVKESSACMIYPNPANDKIFIKTDSKLEAFYLYDILGKLIEVPYSKTDDNNLSVNVSVLPSGIYQLRLVTKNGIFNKKVSVAH